MSRDAYRDEEGPLTERAAELRQRLEGLAELQQAKASAEAELANVEARLAVMKKRSLPMIALENVTIAEPCSASWDAMVPVSDDTNRVRFCGLCSKNVFNLSEMTRDEAMRFVANVEGTACVRFYKRADGTMLTSDCPVGVTRRRRRKIIGMAVAALSSLSASAGLYAFASAESPRCGMTRGAREDVGAQEVEHGAGDGRGRLDPIMGGIRALPPHAKQIKPAR